MVTRGGARVFAWGAKCLAASLSTAPAIKKKALRGGGGGGDSDTFFPTKSFVAKLLP